jgi:uroporphyrinogen-III synthase
VATRGPDHRPLAGLAALVVRASRDDDAFTALLDGLGCRVHALPVMAIQPLAAAALPALSAFDKVVVVSANAARLARDQLRAAPQTAALGREWFAVGAGSAAPLRDAGFPVTWPGEDATSEGLLALPAFAQVAGQRVLVIRGEGGRDVLRAGLVARGARVSFCELYRRVPDDSHRNEIRQLLAGGAVGLVVIHSVDVLRHLLGLLDGEGRRALAATPLLVPSDSAAALARDAGCRTVVRAASALPGAMVDAMVGWYTAANGDFQAAPGSPAT